MTTSIPRILICLGIVTRVAVSQDAPHPIKVGEIVHNMLFPSHEFIGGMERVIEDVSYMDEKHLGCGKRQICEAMSLGSAIARSDGGFDYEKGFLRQAVDAAVDALFEVSKPFMEVFGMGRVARREVSFTQFLVDMVDSVIIE